MTKRALLPEDLYNLKFPAGPQLSPDAKFVVYAVTRVDKEKDKGLTDLYLYEVDTGKTKRLTSQGQEGSPRFSPDSSRLAFISERSGKPQIYILELCGGEAWALPTPQAVSGPLVWFADGRCIAFTARVFSKHESWTPYNGAPEGDASRLKDNALKLNADKKTEPDKTANDIKVITRFRYRSDGIGYFGDLRKQIFVREVPSEVPLSDLQPCSKQVTTGDYDHNSFTIAPDGRHLIVEAKRYPGADIEPSGELWLFELESGRETLLYKSPGPALEPQWSSCGRYIAFASHDNSYGVSTNMDLYVLKIEDSAVGLNTSSPPVNITKAIDRCVVGSGYWARGEYYFTVADHGTLSICKTTPDGELSRIYYDQGRALSSVHGNDTAHVFCASKPNAPDEVYLLTTHGEQQVSYINTVLLQDVSFGKWEKISYQSNDGQDIEGWVIYPADYVTDQRYPLALLIHGGPHGWYGPSFMPLAQQLAGEGYVVLLTNPRGSQSYGQKYAAVIDRDWGNLDYKDVMSGVDELLNQNVIDEDNIFVHGWSYGGYLTCWIVGQTRRFKAACAGASVTNMVSDYGTSDITLADEWEYGGTPWFDGQHLLHHSPLSYASNVETPLLLMHGENDMRCPIGQTEEFYIALKRLGREVVMIRYPGEFHGPRKPIHKVDVSRRLIAWFNYHRNQKG